MYIIIENICPSLNDSYELTIPKINTRNNGYLVKQRQNLNMAVYQNYLQDQKFLMTYL